MKREAHERVVSGLFDSRDAAHQAVDELGSIRLETQDIELISSQEELEAEEYSDIAGIHMHDESVHAAKIGGIAGMILAGATTLTAMIMHGNGALATALIVAICSAAGGLLGTVIGAGFTEDESRVTDMGLRSGKVLLAVHTHSFRDARLVERIFKGRSAHAVHHY